MDFAGTPKEKKKKITTTVNPTADASKSISKEDYLKHLNSQFPKPPPNK
jgi:hypothetical protein